MKLKLILATLSAGVLVACGGGGAGGGGGGGVIEEPPLALGAQFLESSDRDAQEVDVSINANGIGHAVWRRELGGEARLFSRRYANGVWEEEKLIDRPGADEPTQPQVVTLPSGEALAIWDGSNTRVMFSTTENGEWKLPEQLTTGAASIDGIELAADAQGNALAVWRHNNAGLFAAYFTEADGFEDPEALGFSFLNPGLVMDSAGNALAIWLEGVNVNGALIDRVKIRSFSNGQWALASKQLNDNFDKSALAPSAALGPNGKAVAVWAQNMPTDGGVHLLAREANDATLNDWGTVTVLSGDGFSASNPDVAMNAQGQAVAVWQRKAGVDTRINVVASRLVGNVWQVAEAIETDDTGHAVRPQVGIDANGRAMAVWMQDDSVRFNMLSNRLDPITGKWGATEAIEADNVGSVADAPLFAMNTAGRAIAAWLHEVTHQSGITDNDVLANVFK